MQILAHNAIIEYALSGTPIESASRVIVFLPGWGRTKSDFDPLGKMLEERVPETAIVQLDLPGFGGSPMPTSAGVNIPEYVEILDGFFQKLGIRNTVLVGHSFGAKIAVAYAARHSENVEKLVLISAAGVSKKMLRARIARLLSSIGRLMSAGFQDAVLLRRTRHLARRFFAGSDYRLSPPFLRETLKKNFAYDITPDATRVKTPTLLVWGKDDVITPLRDGTRYQSLIRDSRLEALTGCGHFPFLKYPEKCADLIASFLTTK